MRMMPALETCEGECLGSSMLVVASQSTRRVTLLPFTLMPSLCHFPSFIAAPNSMMLPSSGEPRSSW